MPTPAYDIVIRGGTLATATDVFRADLGIVGERIAAIGLDLPAGESEIDATGKLVLPGGVDTHCHIEQLSGGGLMNADSFETATRSAAFGGTTSVISFAAQHRGKSLATTVVGLCRAGEEGRDHRLRLPPDGRQSRRADDHDGPAGADFGRAPLGQGVHDL